MALIGFPLLLIPFAIINIIAFLMPAVSLTDVLYDVPLPSGLTWSLTFSDALVAFAMLLLFFEIAKAARPGAKYFTDHLLSFLVFAGAAAEFALLPKPQFATSTFFLLTVLAFVDFAASIVVRVRRARLARDVAHAAAPMPEPPLARAPAPAPVSPLSPKPAAEMPAPAVEQPAPVIITPPPPRPSHSEVVPAPSHDVVAAEPADAAHTIAEHAPPAAPDIEPPRR
jgi:hypothetical protein